MILTQDIRRLDFVLEVSSEMTGFRASPWTLFDFFTSKVAEVSDQNLYRCPGFLA